MKANRGAVLLAMAVLAAGCANALSSASPASQSAPGVPVPTLSLAAPSPTQKPALSPSATPTMAPTAVPSPSPSAAPTGSLPAGTSYVRYGSRAYKVVAITVDDCFSPTAVEADLAIFERYHVNVTWFPIGHVAALYPALWRQVDAAGFPIANHTFDHQNLTVKTYAQVVADIEEDSNTLKAIIGHPIMPFVRPYAGATNDTVLAAAAAAGERAVVNWDTVEGDTDGGLAEYSNVARLTQLGEGGRNGSIILMHANHEYTTAALPAIIGYYRSHGYQFVTLGQLLGVPGPVPYGPEPATFIPAPSPPPPLAANNLR